MSLDIDKVALEATNNIMALKKESFIGGETQMKAAIQNQVSMAIRLYNTRLQHKLKERTAELDKLQRLSSVEKEDKRI